MDIMKIEPESDNQTFSVISSGSQVTSVKNEDYPVVETFPQVKCEFTVSVYTNKHSPLNL
jgi:hypothetical protein